MNTALWIAQAMLFIVFLYSGFYKSSRSAPELVAMGQTGVEGMQDPFIHFIGVVELLGCAGIIFPWLLKIVPVLTPVAAVGFGIIMVPAGIIHIRRGEYGVAVGNTVVLLLAAFVAVGRFSQL
ncbi:MAG: DoxX family protein [Williamsia sp.]|nr:DoxX family protein [Williamsia sp.]